MRGSLARGRDRDWVLLYPMALKLSSLLSGSELQGVPAPGPVDDIDRNLERGEDLAQSRNVAASLFGKQVGPRPRLAQDLSDGEVPVGMIEQELEELKFSNGECGLHASETDHPALRIEHGAIEIRETAVPQLEPFLVAVHLALDDQDVRLRRPPGDRRELAHVAPDPIEDSVLELDQVGIDTHPVSGVFPMRGRDVLALERPGSFTHARRENVAPGLGRCLQNSEFRCITNVAGRGRGTGDLRG